MSKEYIAIVDKEDNILGYKEKMLVHEEGILHRAFSVLLLNDKNEILLQRRALEKYHSPGEWTNTCCSHQRENENIKEAAIRRLEEELGIKFSDIYEKFVFHYECKFNNELYENEIDHVFVGRYNGGIDRFNKNEVCDTKWIAYKELKKWILEKPEEFTFWFKNIMEIIPENFKF
ncbi:MAG: isopentenyl-diphosphate Delta-isomerase [Sarcina sp.]